MKPDAEDVAVLAVHDDGGGQAGRADQLPVVRVADRKVKPQCLGVAGLPVGDLVVSGAGGPQGIYEFPDGGPARAHPYPKQFTIDYFRGYRPLSRQPAWVSP